MHPVPYIGITPTDFERATIGCQGISPDAFTIKNWGLAALNYSITSDQPWLSVSTESGQLGEMGEGVIEVAYDLGGPYVNVPPGVHTGTITISDPNASNNPQQIVVMLEVQRVLADVDADGDVDQSDFGLFQACISGPGMAQIDPRCESMRFDGDTDVDFDDFGILQACMSGANICPDPNCHLDVPQ
jgi:hypothetical protein